jgi:hypothetical protein
MPNMKPLIETVYIFFLLDQLKEKLNLNVDDMDKLTVDDLRSQVDHAVSQVSLQERCINEWWSLELH